MKNENCAEKSDQICLRSAWIMLATGLLFALKLFSGWVTPDWQNTLQMIITIWGLVISLMIIWTLAPTFIKKIKFQTVEHPEQEGYVTDILNQSLVISWGVTFVGMVMLQSIDTVLLSRSLSGAAFFDAMLALMTLSASVTFLYLTHSGYDQTQDEGWD